MAMHRMILADDIVREEYAACSRNARYLFDRMACFCDDRGSHPDSPELLLRSVFPRDDDLTPQSVRAMLDELLAAGLLISDSATAGRLLTVADWESRQQRKAFNQPHKERRP